MTRYTESDTDEQRTADSAQAPDERRTDATDDRTMAAVSHTNPYTGESMGQVFEHGVTIVADGGRDPSREPRRDGGPADDASDESTTDDQTRDRMADVSHTVSTTDAANRVFQRGGERGTVRETEY